MGLEQSLNRDSKTSGGIAGFTIKQGAVDRWFLTAHEKSSITAATKIICGLEEQGGEYGYKELAGPRKRRDENDIRAIIKALDELMLDPFELKETINDEAMVSPLINVATGLVPGNLIAESLLSSFEKGKQCMKDFIEKRIQAKDVGFHEPLPQLKLKTFTALRRKSQAVKDNKMKSFSADRELFGRLMVIAKSRDLDLHLLFKHELSSVPISLAHPDGSMRKAVKSRLLNELETFVTPINQLPKIAENEIWIIDGMALIQMMSVKGLKDIWRFTRRYFENGHETISILQLSES